MKLHNTYLDIIKEETSSGDASGYSSKYALIKKLKDDNVLTEMPHTHYDKTDIPDLSNVYVDFKFEKMKISNDERNILMKSFYKQGVLIKLKKKDKYAKVTPDDVVIISGNKNNLPIMPSNWKKYITITSE